MSGELRSSPSPISQYSSRISSIMAATSAAPAPTWTGTGRTSGSAATNPLLPGARGAGPVAGTHYDAVMQTRPRLAMLLSLFAALLTALVLTSGCSSEKKNDAPLPDAAALLKQSQ